MKRFVAMSTGARTAVVVAGAVISAGLGYWAWEANVSETADDNSGQSQITTNVAAPAPNPAVPAQSPQPFASLAPTDVAPTAAPAVSLPEAASAPLASAMPDAEPPLAQPVSPSFDLVRVEPDGQALVAGKAAAGAKVVLRLDGVEISATTANAQGNFVVLFAIEPSDAPRMLTMGSILPGQSEVVSLGQVALAATAAPTTPPPATTAMTGAVADPVVAPETDDTTLAAALQPPQDTPAALLITEDGVSVLQSSDQPAPDADPVSLSLDTISYTAAGAVQLAGRAAAGTVVRVYLNNSPLIDLAVGDDGRWASTMPPIAPGIYTLRIDALAVDGSVTNRFETPFKRETQDALAVAAQGTAPGASTAISQHVTAALAAENSGAPAAVPPPPLALAPVAPDATLMADPAPGLVANPAQQVAPLVPPADQTETAVPLPIQEPPAKPVSVTVQPGFTLWGIASEQFGDGVLYVQVFEANKAKIRDPDLIYPGQVFIIPARQD